LAKRAILSNDIAAMFLGKTLVSLLIVTTLCTIAHLVLQLVALLLNIPAVTLGIIPLLLLVVGLLLHIAAFVTDISPFLFNFTRLLQYIELLPKDKTRLLLHKTATLNAFWAILFAFIAIVNTIAASWFVLIILW
jgi:hypothetical protein